MPAPAIPTIDITALLDPKASASDKQQVAAALLTAFTVYGVLYITSPTHPVFSSSKTSEILSATQRLFALNDTDKSHIPKIKPGGFTRGYVPIGGESGSTTKELKEGFSYGYEWSEQDLKAKESTFNKLQGPNSWPTDDTIAKLDGDQSGSFKGALDEFYLNVCDVAAGLLKGISLALGLPESELSKYCSSSETISFMRLFHYLPYADPDNKHASQIGSSAHTDWGFLTLILSPSKTVGLQLFYENEWHDVPSVENTLVINGGDYLSLLTGGKFISPLHRVVSNGQEERYSMCCFYYPDYDAKIPLLVQEEMLKGQAASGNYSLLRDQRSAEDLESEAGGTEEQDAKSVATRLLNGETNFGDYIVSKWTQVYRKGGAY
ncbi:hypothetical protein BG004_000923 [Podila humilis]|nr:hypothetical protein BG004_000923 [Podila humilis]